MGAVLITGMSGTGKSTVIAELAARGHHTIDTDYDGWCIWDGGGWLWDEPRMTALLASKPDVFIAGTVSNQGKFYDRFDAVVLLSIPAAVLLERLATRTTNDYGKSAAEREETLGYLETVEPLLRTGATLEIDTQAPLADVVAAIEALM